MLTFQPKKLLLIAVTTVIISTLTIEGSSSNRLDLMITLEKSSESKSVTWWNWVNNFQPSLYQLLELVHVNDVSPN